MKKLFSVILISAFSISAFSQDLFSKFNFETVLPADQFGETMKIIWDEVKKEADEFYAKLATKGEFESTAAFQNRIQRDRELMHARLRKIISDNKFDTRRFIVSMKAELMKYDADNQAYSIKSSNKASLPPSKDNIRFSCLENNYVAVIEKNENGYRRSYLVLKSKPEFTWYVEPQLAIKAKTNEGSLFFKIWFALDIDISNPEYVKVQLIPKKISLTDVQANFTYWTEDQ